MARVEAFIPLSPFCSSFMSFTHSWREVPWNWCSRVASNSLAASSRSRSIPTLQAPPLSCEFAAAAEDDTRVSSTQSSATRWGLLPGREEAAQELSVVGFGVGDGEGCGRWGMPPGAERGSLGEMRSDLEEDGVEEVGVGAGLGLAERDGELAMRTRRATGRPSLASCSSSRAASRCLPRRWATSATPRTTPSPPSPAPAAP